MSCPKKLTELIFVHDGAPCHKGRSVTEFLDVHGIERLPWLGNSPGKNPIESPLSILKSEMQQKTMKNKRQLIEELISAWRREDSVRNACNEMVHSMPADVAARNNAKAHLPNTKRTLCFILMRFVLFLSLYGFYIKENRLNTSRKPRKQFL